MFTGKQCSGFKLFEVCGNALLEAEARNNNYERKVGTETVKFYEREFHAAAIERVAVRAEAEAEE